MLRHILLLLLAMPALGGCAGAEIVAFAVRPLFSPRPEAAPDPHEAARRHFAEGRFAAAATQFRAALARDRNSVTALNGLAASYDRLGRHDLAERYYREALAIDPLSAQTLNNLGYSYYLQGKPELALAYLSHAKADAADSAVTAGNRHLAETALEGAAPASPPAAALVPVAAAALVGEPPPPAPPARVPAAHVELANGAGRDGMAARLGAYLRGKGVAVARVTNARPFDKGVTTIFYRPDLRASAEGIAALLPAPVRMAASGNQREPLRIVLGRDLIQFDNRIASSTGGTVQ
jgi:tetratricopeptide (TPR) repeat protein